MTKDKIVL